MDMVNILYLHILYRKSVFNLIQHFVHLNLSIALLLGLLTFVSGIETASEYRVSHHVTFRMFIYFLF